MHTNRCFINKIAFPIYLNCRDFRRRIQFKSLISDKKLEKNFELIVCLIKLRIKLKNSIKESSA
jgi:hypothetical protein